MKRTLSLCLFVLIGLLAIPSAVLSQGRYVNGKLAMIDTIDTVEAARFQYVADSVSLMVYTYGSRINKLKVRYSLDYYPQTINVYHRDPVYRQPYRMNSIQPLYPDLYIKIID